MTTRTSLERIALLAKQGKFELAEREFRSIEPLIGPFALMERKMVLDRLPIFFTGLATHHGQLEKALKARKDVDKECRACIDHLRAIERDLNLLQRVLGPPD